MSVASLENGNLTLGNLTINNSQYAEAFGYVASQTVFSSTKNSTSLNALTIGDTPLSSVNGGLSINSGQGGLSCGEIDCISNASITGTVTIGSSNCVLDSGSGGGLSINSGQGGLSCGEIDCISNASIEGTITLGSGTTTVLSASSGGLSIASGNGSLACGDVDCIGNASIVGTITLGGTGFSGVLSANGSGQLTWNGAVIS